MKIEQSLVPITTTPAGQKLNAVSRNGGSTRPQLPKVDSPPAALNDELVDQILKGQGLRGWLRVANVSRVLGLLTLYLFLDSYDIRAKFNRRTAERLREVARAGGRRAQFTQSCRDVVGRMVDRAIRALRFLIFRGADGSDKKLARLEKQAVWLRENLITLGPTFIKIGQALGTRGDLLPLSYIKQLSTLQDQVPAFPTAEAYARIEAALGRSLQEAYAEIDAEPIAAASLGQVYRARLHDGREVAVKVQRPNLKEIISFDIAVLYRLVKLTNRFFPRANENADWEGMLREFYHTIFEEMDYAREGRNADRFRHNFRDWRAVRVPVIHWSHSTSHVLTMEFVRGTKVVDLEALRARGISPVKVNRL
ncbi:MAG TPA: AarF/UbiB family protein, partial [Pyrinomonadaceae bacterium]|nr:AarF/UbiB family protein [Pyrinomonadaceae bacterium]